MSELKDGPYCVHDELPADCAVCSEAGDMMPEDNFLGSMGQPVDQEEPPIGIEQINAEALAKAMRYSAELDTNEDMILFDWHRAEDDPELSLAAARVILERISLQMNSHKMDEGELEISNE